MQADPYLWLEEIEREDVLAWVKTQNQISTSQLEGITSFQPLFERIKTSLDSNEKIPFVSAKNGLLYNFWRDAKHVRGLWRRTNLESYQTSDPEWEVLLDLDQLATQEGQNWVWQEAVFDQSHTRVLMFLSNGGSDARVMREFDLLEKTFVVDGFTLPEAKSRVAWIDHDTLWVGTDFGEGSLNNSGYPRLVKVWKRGLALETASTVFEGATTDVWAYAFRQKTAPHRIFLQRGLDFFTNQLMLCHDGGMAQLNKQNSAKATPFGEWLLLELREDWLHNGITYPQGALLVANLEAAFVGQADWQVLFTPSLTSALAGFALTKNYIVLNILENVQNRLEAVCYTDGAWKSTPLTTPNNASVYVSAFDQEQNDDIWLTITSFLIPNTLMLGSITDNQFRTIKTSPSYFEAKHLQVQQLEAVSADGTRIPYFQIARKDLVQNSKNPTILYGYGGFEVAELPYYSPSIGMAWLEQGGVFVMANIRGGGEFGPRWHRAALRENRQRAFDDFIAIAEDLIARQITSSQHLGIRGGSNGGLLMGAMFTQRPELFRAVVCAVPLLDMQRYHKLLAGASWVAEYGDPDHSDDWAFIKKYSPYHNVHTNQTYPRILFTTSTRDDRVHPAHARKMYAKMLEMGHRVLYFENTEGGHAGAANNTQTARKLALEYTYLWRELTSL